MQSRPTKQKGKTMYGDDDDDAIWASICAMFAAADDADDTDDTDVDNTDDTDEL